jgi:hypothetical protein
MPLEDGRADERVSRGQASERAVCVCEAVSVEKGARRPPLPTAVVCPPGRRRRRRLAEFGGIRPSHLPILFFLNFAAVNMGQALRDAQASLLRTTQQALSELAQGAHWWTAARPRTSQALLQKLNGA